MKPTQQISEPPTLDEIRRALAARPPAPLREPPPRAAAVAIVLRPAYEGLAVLFIRRAECPADYHWVPLRELLDPARRAPFPYVHDGTELSLPSICVGGLIIWGLAYQMIEGFQLMLALGRK